MPTTALLATPATIAPKAAGATLRLATFVSSAAVDPAAVAAAVPVALDTLAVTVAGGVEPAVLRLATTLGAASGPDAVPSLWGPAAFRQEDAALLYGMASHVLDYDDVSMIAFGHPSAPILSAALAARPWDALSGRELLEALAIGTETTIRLGEAMGFRHYALGFHATATLGTVGAAAAAARLMRLPPGETRHALAIAASMASGLRKNFGSMVKSLHVGLAAANGILAARLAAAGIEGAPEPFEEEGYLRAFSGGETDRIGETVAFGKPFAIAVPGFEQKRYPCCYLLHKMIEATLTLGRETGVRLDEVASARVEMPRGGTKPLIHPYPKNGLNALFSGPHAVVAALADGRIDLASFTDEAVLRPAVQARLADVEVVEVGEQAGQGADIGAAPVTVILRRRDGGELRRTVTASPGSTEDPLTAVQLAAKWHDCLSRARRGLAAADSGALFAAGLGLAGMRSVGPWLADLRRALAG